jgi:hypothetical protein
VWASRRATAPVEPRHSRSCELASIDDDPTTGGSGTEPATLRGRPAKPQQSAKVNDELAPRRKRGGYRPWAELLRRTFAIDVLECLACKGGMKLVAMLTESWSIARFLSSALGEPTDVPARSPDRGPPYWKSSVLRRKALGDAAWPQEHPRPDQRPDCDVRLRHADALLCAPCAALDLLFRPMNPVPQRSRSRLIGSPRHTSSRSDPARFAYANRSILFPFAPSVACRRVHIHRSTNLPGTPCTRSRDVRSGLALRLSIASRPLSPRLKSKSHVHRRGGLRATGVPSAPAAHREAVSSRDLRDPSAVRCGWACTSVDRMARVAKR